MKQLILATILLFSATAQAQTSFQTAKMDVYCANGAAVKSVIDKFSERAFIQAEVERLVGAQQTEVFEQRIFVNPTTKTFTIVEKIAEDVYCIIATGDKFAPVIQQGEGV